MGVKRIWRLFRYLRPYVLFSLASILLMAPSLDRSGAIGFRCVKDGAE